MLDALQQAYDEYFNRQEVANRHPLTFEQWLMTEKDINPRAPACRAGFADCLLNRPYCAPEGEYKALEYAAGWQSGERLGVKSILTIGKG